MNDMDKCPMHYPDGSEKLPKSNTRGKTAPVYHAESERSELTFLRSSENINKDANSSSDDGYEDYSISKLSFAPSYNSTLEATSDTDVSKTNSDFLFPPIKEIYKRKPAPKPRTDIRPVAESFRLLLEAIEERKEWRRRNAEYYANKGPADSEPSNYCTMEKEDVALELKPNDKNTGHWDLRYGLSRQ